MDEFSLETPPQSNTQELALPLLQASFTPVNLVVKVHQHGEQQDPVQAPPS